MKNRIAVRLFAYFAVALLAFALSSGVLFRSLFTQQALRMKKADMQARAETLSQTLSGVLAGSSSAGNGMGGQGGGYGAFVRMLSLTETNVWVLDEHLEFLSSGHMQGKTVTYDDLPTDASMLVQQVFQGETPFSEGFSDILGAPTLTLGVPIMLNGQVVGALLLHDAVSGMESATRQGMEILLLSGAAALVFSSLLAILFSLTFTRPINRMKETALRLAGGEYAAKTEVRQKDEIGMLAEAIDTLSDKLAEAKEAGERQDQLRQDFFANVSHELRTPVTVLRGSLEALCDGVVTEPETVSEYHRQMLAETKNLQRLVNDLMELSRLQNTDFPIESEPLSLTDAVNDALRSAERLAKSKQIRLERSLPETPAAFQGDYGRLRQMFLIVLDNAVKFSPPQSTVSVALTGNQLTILDEGVGIAPDELPLIFDRFHKADNQENQLGSGLGLAIAKQIALRHGMHVGVESTVGKGTAFTFTWE